MYANTTKHRLIFFFFFFSILNLSFIKKISKPTVLKRNRRTEMLSESVELMKTKNFDKHLMKNRTN